MSVHQVDLLYVELARMWNNIAGEKVRLIYPFQKLISQILILKFPSREFQI